MADPEIAGRPARLLPRLARAIAQVTRFSEEIAASNVADSPHVVSRRGQIERMSNIKLIALTAVSLALAAVDTAADWKAHVARRVVGRAVREGLEDAIEDAALDVVLDTAVASAAPYSASTLRDIDKLDTIADSVGDGVEAAMRVSDVASTLDNAADVARAVKKINKVRKLGR